jgi:WD40 repeat protein
MKMEEISLPMQNRNTTINSNNPYPGLRPFEFTDARYFFGRDEPTSELLSKLTKHRFLAVLGTSGSGKSSLVKAGLLQALNSGFMVEAGSSWKLAIMRPGGKPITELARNLQKKVFQPSLEDQTEAESEESTDPELVLEITEATLLEGSRGLIHAVQLWGLEPGDNLLLVVDQFEELFRLKSGDSVDKIACDESDAFVKLLLAATKQKEVSIYVVITMRSEYLGQCSVFRELPEALNECQYLIPRLSQAQLRLAIEAPAKLEGARISKGLMNLLLKDLGDDPDQLPVLQHALMRTWDHWQKQHPRTDELSIDNYDKIGGIDEALSQHADEIYKNLGPSEQIIARSLFCCLTEKDTVGKEGNRRPTSVKEISAVAETTVDQVIAVADAFRGPRCNFLMPPADEDLQAETKLDISHESLMRVWVKLKEWMEKEAQSAQMYRWLMDRHKAAIKSASTDISGFSFIQGADVTMFDTWRQENSPNSSWARLYSRGEYTDADYEAAIKYLDDSIKHQKISDDMEKKRVEDTLNAEKARRKSAESQRWWAFAGLLFFGFWASLFLHQLQRAKIAQAKTFNAVASASIEKDPLSSLLNSLAAADLLDDKTSDQLLLANNMVTAAKNNLQVKIIETGQGQILSLALLKKGETISLISGGVDGTIRRWKIDASGIVPDKTIKTEHGPVQSLAVLKNGDLISGHANGTIQRWTDDGKEIRRVGEKIDTKHGPIQSLAVLTNGDLISGGAYGTIQRWKIDASRIVLVQTIKTEHGPVQSLAVLKNGDLISGAADGTISRWKDDGRKVNREFKPIPSKQTAVLNLTMLKNGDLISGGADGTIRRWKINASSIIPDPPIKTGQRQVKSITVLNKNGKLISGGADGTIRRWKIDARDIIVPDGSIPTQQDSVNSMVTLDSENGELYTGGQDGTIRRWRRDPKSLRYALNTPASSGQSLSMLKLKNGDLIIGGADGTISRWSLQGKKYVFGPSTQTKQQAVMSLTMLKNGDLVSGGNNGTIQRWTLDGKSFRPVGEMIVTKQVPVPVLSLAVWNEDLISGGADGMIQRWKHDGKKFLREGIEINTHHGPVLSLAVWNEDLISGGGGDKDIGTVRRWKINEKDIIAPDQSIVTNQGPVKSLAVWNKDLITGGFDGTIQIWRHPFNKVGNSIDLDKGKVMALAGLESGLMSMGEEGTIHYWLDPKLAIKEVCNFLQIDLLPLERSRKTSAFTFLYSALNSLRSETAKKDSEEIRQVINKANKYCNRFLSS